MFKKIWVALCCLGLLNACSMLSPVKTDPVNHYVINSQPNPSIRKTSHAKDLLVMLPDSNAFYNTVAMAYSAAPYQVNYFAKNNWADTPAQMIKPLIIEILQKTQHFHSVTGTLLPHFDYILQTEILIFQQNFIASTSIFALRINARIIDARTNATLASKLFNVSMPAEPTPYGGVVAANQAMSQFLLALATFCAEKI